MNWQNGKEIKDEQIEQKKKMTKIEEKGLKRGYWSRTKQRERETEQMVKKTEKV